MKKDIITQLYKLNISFTPLAKKYLLDLKETNYENLIKLGENLIQNNKKIIITKELLEIILKQNLKLFSQIPEENLEVITQNYFENDLKLLNPMNLSKLKGETNEFLKLIQFRFNFFKKKLTEENLNIYKTNVQEIKQKNNINQENVNIIGYIREIKKGNNISTILIEDEFGIIYGKIENELLEKEIIFPNEILLFLGKIKLKKFFIIKIIRKKQIMRKNYEKKDFKIFILSDLHSSHYDFKKKRWDKMINWLIKNYKKNKIKYLLILGDNVEGIGIYPKQEFDIIFNTLKEQYNYLKELLKKIPLEIRIICIPGNHDIVRLSEPQPQLTEDIKKMLDSRIIFFNNPALIEIETYRLLIYHGRALNQFSDQFIDKFPFSDPIPGMKQMIEMSHICPTIQGRTQLYPTKEDYLILNNDINVFLTGHIHMIRYGNKNGIHLVNCSAWIGQTHGMKKSNIFPEICAGILINVLENSIEIIRF